ncbi:MAG: amino acid--tRNA ligase-related protein, partial [bacterium]
DTLGDEVFGGLRDLDVGDFAGVCGRVFRTRTKELTVEVSSVTVLAKALRPPPEKWHGLKDADIRYRRRALDLLSNPEVREIFRIRAKAIRAIRDALDARDYLEVETPVLQPLYGGADATPFTTFYESLKTTYYLRISNELYLKRLLVGGLDRVYEFSKDFRNEGLDRMHTPEFTLLELYEAYADYEGMMRLTEDLFRTVVTAVNGSPVLTYQGLRLDFAKAWRRVSFVEELRRALGFDPLDADVDTLRRTAMDHKIADAARLSRPKLLDKLFGFLVQDKLDGPVFVTDHPVDLSPLAKAHRGDPRLVERFEPIIAGFEVGNAFSELNDPDEQRHRFEAQARL